MAAFFKLASARFSVSNLVDASRRGMAWQPSRAAACRGRVVGVGALLIFLGANAGRQFFFWSLFLFVSSFGSTTVALTIIGGAASEDVIDNGSDSDEKTL